MARIELAPDVLDDFERIVDHLSKIGRGSRGYVALYRFVATIDTVFVLAVRSQRESGYKHPP